jgi:eukaryotic-like serine/threonine-protein kinase
LDKTRAHRLAGELRGSRVGGWIVGPYLGNGYSALVLEAEKDDVKAALKIIDPEMVERAGVERQLARVRRERELAGHGHPNLVDILDGGQCSDTGHLFVAMELLEPRPLGQVRNILPASRIGPLVAQLARAARFLESRGIAHRDIKPDNTNVEADFANIKLLDLGVIHPPADPNDPSAGTGNSFVGTARYSPPEFLYREEEDSVEGWRAVTFYQLGSTLYDLLMRRPIFDEFREPPARLYQAVKDHVPLIDVGDAELWLVDLARRCLHKDWRVRKAIVRWDDFEGPPVPASTAEEVRERLKRRGIGRAVAIMNDADAKERPTRRTLEQLSGAVATTVREVCHQGGVFPPVEVTHSITDDKCTVTLQTGPSAAHDLAATLGVHFVTTPVDARATYIRVSAAARLGAAPAEALEAMSELFVGEHSALRFREAVDLYLHTALEAALGTGAPPVGGLPIKPIVKGSE